MKVKILKILATIGPNKDFVNYIKKILKFTKYVRTNASHNTIKWHEDTSRIIKKINKKAFYLLDIPGIKPRTLNEKELFIKKNEVVSFIFKKKIINNGKYKTIRLSKPLPKINKVVKHFSLYDGRYEFKILSFKKNQIVGKSLSTFILLPGKGLNIPLSIYDEILQNKMYLDFLSKCKKIDFNAIGISYIQSSKVINKIRARFPKQKIVSKIENLEGVNNLEEIISSTDIVMIDRGDLCAEIGYNNLFATINKIAATASEYKKPLIMATENLDNMILNLNPTKSEIISLEYSKLIGTSFIMLSEETATSSNWFNTIRWLENFIKKKL